MILDDVKARELIKTPKNASLISSARKYESTLRVFTEELDESELQKEIYWSTMQEKMRSRSNKKFERVIQFARFPLPVVHVTDSILTDYFKVFEGKNRYFNVESNNNIERLKVWINDNKPENWIEQHAREILKNKPCSFVVVDRDESGDPYLISVDSNRIVDAEVKDKNGNCEYIIFLHHVEKHETKDDVNVIFYSVYDDETYRVFRTESDNPDLMVEVVRKAHNIGYCPARTFIKEQTNTKNPFKRRVAFGQSISKLEDWTIFDIFRNYVDHYAPFPITEAPKKKCANNRCKGGKVEEKEIINRATNQTRIKWTTCPVCDGKDESTLMFPGTHLGIKLQADKTREDGSGKFKMHFPETDKMKYVPEKLDAIELDVRYKTVGVSQLLSKESVNELQVKGSFVSMESVLIRVKEEFDDLYKWIVNTVSSVIYNNVLINVEANFGTEFYLISEENLQMRYEKAKEIGLPKSELILIYQQLIETKYKGDNNKVNREKLLLNLDPLPLFSQKDALELYEKGAIDDTVFNFKINFYKFVQMFEINEAPITEFGVDLEPGKRIEKILLILNKYNDESISKKGPVKQQGPGSEATE